MKNLKLILFLQFIFIISLSYSQDTINYPEKSFLRKDQNWRIDVPIWIPGFRGEFSQGEVKIDNYNEVEIPGDDKDRDILKWLFPTRNRLEFYFVGRIKFQKGRFFSQFDALSGKFGTSVDFRLTNREIIDASLSISIPKLIAGFKFYEYENSKHSSRISVLSYIGVRYFLIKISSKHNDLINRLNINPVWADAIIGIKVPWQFHRWQFVLQSDYGGFGFDNNQSWHTIFNSSFRISKLMTVKMGWNDLDIKHSGKIDGEEFDINIHLSGPLVGVSFHF